MREKGFNLFTALLAAMIIMIGSMLVLIMITTERETSTAIEGTTADARLEAVMRTMRTDVLSSFNHFVREQIEKYVSENEVNLNDLNVWADWKELVKSFVHGYFGERERPMLAYQLSQSMPTMFERYKQGLVYEARYEVKVVGDMEKLKEISLELILNSAEEDDFIQIVKCDGTPAGCPTGTFYINLRLSKLTNEQYESLPRIVVKDLVTGKEQREIILPRNDIKMYVPLRLFKAMAYARYFLHSDLQNINSSSDYGYLSPRIHNEIDSMALGMCDYGYCRPRENPYFPPTARYIDDKACPRAPKNALTTVQGTFRGYGFSYDASDKSNMKETLAELVKRRICELSQQHLAPLSSEEFSVRKSAPVAGVDCYVNVTDTYVQATSSKKIEFSSSPGLALTGLSQPQEPNNPSACPFNFILPQNRRIGYYLEGTKILWPADATGNYIGEDICEGFLASVSGQEQKHRMCEVANWSCCAELSEIQFTMTFIEGDANYKVNRNRNVKFNIQVTDRSYTPFNPNYDSGDVLSSAGCTLEHKPTRNGCNTSGWVCRTYESAGTYAGCYPEAT